MFDSQINRPKLVHPTHNTCNIDSGQAIMVFTKHIEPMKNNSLLQKSNHVMEKAKDWCFFCAKFIINMFSDCQINVP